VQFNRESAVRRAKERGRSQIREGDKEVVPETKKSRPARKRKRGIGQYDSLSLHQGKMGEKKREELEKNGAPSKGEGDTVHPLFLKGGDGGAKKKEKEGGREKVAH